MTPRLRFLAAPLAAAVVLAAAAAPPAAAPAAPPFAPPAPPPAVAKARADLSALDTISPSPDKVRRLEAIESELRAALPSVAGIGRMQASRVLGLVQAGRGIALLAMRVPLDGEEEAARNRRDAVGALREAQNALDEAVQAATAGAAAAANPAEKAWISGESIGARFDRLEISVLRARNLPPDDRELGAAFAAIVAAAGQLAEDTKKAAIHLKAIRIRALASARRGAAGLAQAQQDFAYILDFKIKKEDREAFEKRYGAARLAEIDRVVQGEQLFARLDRAEALAPTDPAQARRDLDAILPKIINPENPAAEVLRDRALLLDVEMALARGGPEEAEKRIREIAAWFPAGSPVVERLRAHLRRILGDAYLTPDELHKAASSSFVRAVALSRTDPAKAAAAWDKSVARLSRLLARDKVQKDLRSKSLYLLGGVYHKRGAWYEAHAVFRAAFDAGGLPDADKKQAAALVHDSLQQGADASGWDKEDFEAKTWDTEHYPVAGAGPLQGLFTLRREAEKAETDSDHAVARKAYAALHDGACKTLEGGALKEPADRGKAWQLRVLALEKILALAGTPERKAEARAAYLKGLGDFVEAARGGKDGVDPKEAAKAAWNRAQMVFQDAQEAERAFAAVTQPSEKAKAEARAKEAYARFLEAGRKEALAGLPGLEKHASALQQMRLQAVFFRNVPADLEALLPELEEAGRADEILQLKKRLAAAFATQADGLPAGSEEARRLRRRAFQLRFEIVKPSVEKDPVRLADVRWRFGKDLFEAGDPEGARPYLQDAVKDLEGSADAAAKKKLTPVRLDLFNVLDALHLEKEANDLLKEIMKDPAAAPFLTTDVKLRTARSLLARKEYERAREPFAEIWLKIKGPTEKPKPALRIEVVLGLAECDIERGANLDQVLSLLYFGAVQRLHPDNPDCRFVLPFADRLKALLRRLSEKGSPDQAAKAKEYLRILDEQASRKPEPVPEEKRPEEGKKPPPPAPGEAKGPGAGKADGEAKKPEATPSAEKKGGGP